MAECSGFIVDVSPHMVEEDKVSKVQAYLEYSLMEKCKRQRKTDWVGCYLANCAVTKNPQGVDGVFQVQEWVAPVTITETVGVLRQLQRYMQDVVEGNVNGSWELSGSMVRCLLVSSLECRDYFKTRKMRRQLMVFTDDMEGLDLSAQEIDVLAEELNLLIILVDCRSIEGRNDVGYHYGKWGQLVDAIEGSQIYNINELLEEISSLPTGVVRPVRVFEGELRLGYDVLEGVEGREDGHSLAIRVEGYPATKAVSSVNRKTLVQREVQGKDVYEPVKSVVEYEIRGDEEEGSTPIQVSPQAIAKAYRYGSDYVVLPSSLGGQDGNRASGSGMDIVGFMERSRLPRYLLHSESRFIMADTRYGGIQDVVALGALVDALRDSDQLAIARFVSKPNAEVQMGVLCPMHVEGNHVLVYCRLPFAEDQRVADFPRLTKRTTTSGKEIQRDRLEEHVDSLVSKYIDAFDMDDEPEVGESHYYRLMELPPATNLPLPRQSGDISKLEWEQDPLVVPAIHLHRIQQVLLEWIHQCIINDTEFHVPEMPDALVNKISSRYQPSPGMDETITSLQKVLDIKRSRGRRSSRTNQDEEDEEADQEVPDLHALLSRGQRESHI